MKGQKLRGFLLMIGILCTVWLSSGWSHGATVPPAAMTEAAEALSGISEEEHRIIEELFEMSALIEWMNTEIIRLNREAGEISSEISEKQQQIEQEALAFEKAKANMAQVLKSQQRAGAASVLEIILNAKDLKDLIHRINILRDVSRNTLGLIHEIEDTQARLVEEQQALKDMLGQRQEQQKSIQQARDRQAAARLERERYLNSLQADKAQYEAYLQTMEARWTKLKPLFSDTVRSFNRMIGTGGLPADTVTVSYSLFYAKGRIDEEKLNSALRNRSDLPRLTFGLHADRVTLDFPEYDITLVGKLVRVDSHTLQFDVTGGTFYDFSLSGSAIQDLFSAGDLIFDLGSMIGNHGINRIDTYDGYIELLITGRP